MASIAEYLLSLARDPAKAAEHRSSEDAARAAMDAAGVSGNDQEVILSRDPERIAAAIRAELPASDDDGGIPIMMMFLIDPC